MPSITYKTFLMYKPAGASSSWTKLIDIKDTPDGIISQKEMVDVTTLSDPNVYSQRASAKVLLMVCRSPATTAWKTFRQLKV